MMSDQSRIRVELYEQKYKAQWDELVRQSKNGVFLFYRDYMEYHADRFKDFSLLFFQGSELIALMPANRDGDMAVSHGGLTFGGIISGSRITTPLMLDVFGALVNDLRARGIKKLIYKAIPHIYHLLPAEEDLYALFVHNARLFRRDVSSTIATDRRLPLAKNRKNSARLTQNDGLKVMRSEDFSEFMAIVDANLGQGDAALADFQTAEETYRRAMVHLPDMEKVYGRDLASTLRTHAALLDRMGRSTDADKLRAEAAAL